MSRGLAAPVAAKGVLSYHVRVCRDHWPISCLAVRAGYTTNLSVSGELVDEDMDINVPGRYVINLLHTVGHILDHLKDNDRLVDGTSRSASREADSIGAMIRGHRSFPTISRVVSPIFDSGSALKTCR